jgi:signal transduction histidine kinase
VLLVLLAILPSMGLAIWHGLQDLDQEIHLAEEKAYALAKKIAEDQADLAISTERFLVTLAATDAVQKHDAAACTHLFEALIKQLGSTYLNILAIDLNGQAFAHAQAMVALNNYSDREWFQSTLRSGKFTMSDFLIGRVTKEPTLAMSYPVKDADDKTRMVLAVGISLKWLEKQISTSNFPANSIITILDNSGVVLARYPDFNEIVGTNQSELDIVKKVIGTQDGVAEAISIDGVKRLIGYTKLFHDVPSSPLLYVGIPSSGAHKQAYDALLLHLSLLALVGLAGLLAAWLLGKRFLVKPVEDLSAKVLAIGRGELEARAEGDYQIVEFRTLAESFNKMAEDLQKHETRLMQKSEALERSNRDLEHFAYIASHDLQEPLRKVTSFADLLSRRYSGNLDDKAKSYFDFMVDGAKRMSTLINQLLAYSRLNTTGRDFAPVDCNELVRQVVESIQMAIDEACATLSIGNLPVVSGDQVQLAQVFQNLIENALKFRGPQPLTISIAAKIAANSWEFSVADNGIGIAPEHAERIFLMFQRLHAANEYSGSGIGLAMCKRIVERHGGHIRVEGTPGGGSTFIFTLPQTKEHAQ